MKVQDVVYRQKVGGYVYIYDNNGFIHIFSSEDIEDNTQCLQSIKCACSSKKDFELEILYLHSNNTNSITNLNDE